MEHAELTESIIGCAMKVHRMLGPGFLESVYQNALAHELRKAGLSVECERAIQVTYDGVSVGELPGMIEKLLRVYLRHRAGRESFQQFSTRHDLNALQTWFSMEADV